MITLAVRFCLVLNPYMCQTMEMVPADGHEITSVTECIMGGAIGSTTFTMEHMDWQTRGWRCRERENVVDTWLDQKEK